MAANADAALVLAPRHDASERLDAPSPFPATRGRGQVRFHGVPDVRRNPKARVRVNDRAPWPAGSCYGGQCSCPLAIPPLSGTPRTGDAAYRNSNVYRPSVIAALAILSIQFLIQLSAIGRQILEKSPSRPILGDFMSAAESPPYEEEPMRMLHF